MTLHKITKKSMSGSLLIQFKYTENEGTWNHSTNSNSYVAINNKYIDMTPSYPTSIMETSCSFTIGDISSTQNTTDRFATSLWCNGSLEYEQTDIGGLSPYGNEWSHSGGRNDRTAPTRRTGHVTNVRKSVGFTHAYIPRATNKITFEVKVKNANNDRDFSVKDFFMICKEIGIPEDRVKSGSVNTDVS